MGLLGWLRRIVVSLGIGGTSYLIMLGIMVLSVVYDAGRDGSDLVILDASDFTGPPVATVRLPQRVPFGFHGSWVADSACTSSENVSVRRCCRAPARCSVWRGRPGHRLCSSSQWARSRLRIRSVKAGRL